MKRKLIILISVVLILAGFGFLILLDIMSFEESATTSSQSIELKKVFVQGTNFATEDGEFHFIGAFTTPLLRFMVYNTYFADWQEQIDAYMESYAGSFRDAGPLVMRFNAFGRLEIEDSLGDYGKTYAEPNWERLDYIVDKAEEEGIYLIWMLWDYWNWGEPCCPRYSYWEDPDIRPAIEAMVARYKDRNVIMAWEIINEGDVNEMWYPETHSQIINWINNISAFIKSIDPDGIVSTGFSSELGDPHFARHPEYERIREFIENVHSLPAIDVISVHFYGGGMDVATDASFWTEDLQRQLRWHVEEMVRLRTELAKPLLGGEWGVQRQVGEETLKQVYQFMIDLFTEHEMDAAFNGWGNVKEPPSHLIYSDDEELIIIIQEGMERLISE